MIHDLGYGAVGGWSLLRRPWRHWVAYTLPSPFWRVVNTIRDRREGMGKDYHARNRAIWDEVMGVDESLLERTRKGCDCG